MRCGLSCTARPAGHECAYAGWYRDGDSVSDTVAVDLGGNIRFADDGPSISAGGTGSTLTVDESDFATNATVNLSGLFNATTDFGADGPGFVTYELGVTAGATVVVAAGATTGATACGTTSGTTGAAGCACSASSRPRLSAFPRSSTRTRWRRWP